MLKINDKIPNFEILTDQGEFKVSSHIEKNIVFFFFPKADTSGCTAEAVAFTSLQTNFHKLNCIHTSYRVRKWSCPPFTTLGEDNSCSAPCIM